MRQFPAPIHNAVAAFTRLPAVGPKTALRYTFALLRMSPSVRQGLARAIERLDDVRVCRTCYAHSEEPVCGICSDPRRDAGLLCVVSESRDIATIEATDAYRGRYFVLGGTLSPIEGRTPETLHVRQLMGILDSSPHVSEVILAFSPDVHGETTILYLAKRLKELGKKTTKLARGLPIGADLEYTDEITLLGALEGRREA